MKTKFAITILTALSFVPYAAIVLYYNIKVGSGLGGALSMLAWVPLALSVGAALLVAAFASTKKVSALLAAFHVVKFMWFLSAIYLIAIIVAAMIALFAYNVEFGAILVMWLISTTLFVPYVLLYAFFAHKIFFRFHPELIY